jgi:hypothetical protein
MPTLTRSDLEGMAKDIVSKFMSGDDLEEAILSSSKQGLLNSEQIKRLTELSNTAAFLDLFNNKSGDDRMVEFKVADPSSIIKQYYSSDMASDNPAKGVMSIEIEEIDPSDNDHSIFFDDIAGDKYDKSEIPDESDASDSDEFSLDSGLDIKVASYMSKTAEDSTHKIDKFRAQDLANSLMDKIAHYNFSASDLADEVASNYKGIYSRDKYAQLELDAISRHGNAAIPAMQMLRARLGMAKIARPLSEQEIALIQDRNIVEPSKALDKIAQILDNSAEILKAEIALKKVSNLR